MPRPIRAVIDLSAVRHNLGIARQYAGTSQILGVVKANAYGHGLMRILPALERCDGLALLEIDAACRLREAGYTKPIVLLEGHFDAHDLQVMIEHRLTPVVHSQSQIDVLAHARPPRALDVWVKMNSGMNRLGFNANEFADVSRRIRGEHQITSLVLMTHFASSDDGNGVQEQIELFTRGSNGLALPRSLANSAALIDYPQSRADWVRPGIMLYGASPFADRSAAALSLRAAMRLQSRIIAIQNVGAGATVGYGMSFRASHDMRIGIVACGYADGYPRHAPTGTPVAVEGVRTRTIGRVSMDMIYVDITALQNAGIGSSVELWGDLVSVDEVATAAGTVGYELLCALAPRVPVEVVDASPWRFTGGPAN